MSVVSFRAAWARPEGPLTAAHTRPRAPALASRVSSAWRLVTHTCLGSPSSRPFTSSRLLLWPWGGQGTSEASPATRLRKEFGFCPGGTLHFLPR